MSELYLVAHKVRGEAAFDIAIRLVCVECQYYTSVTGQWCESHKSQDKCNECDSLGYWWIIPTSGHRAHPWWSMELMDLSYKWGSEHPSIIEEIPHMPDGWPDHYPPKSSPAEPKRNLLAELGLGRQGGHAAVAGKLTRRV